MRRARIAIYLAPLAVSYLVAYVVSESAEPIGALGWSAAWAAVACCVVPFVLTHRSDPGEVGAKRVRTLGVVCGLAAIDFIRASELAWPLRVASQVAGVVGPYLAADLAFQIPDRPRWVPHYAPLRAGLALARIDHEKDFNAARFGE